MITRQVTPEQLVANEVPMLVADFFDDILHCTYEKARTAASSVIHNVVEEILFYLLRLKVTDKIIEEHISEYLDTRGAVDKIGEKLLSVNAFIGPMAAFI